MGQSNFIHPDPNVLRAPLRHRQRKIILHTSWTRHLFQRFCCLFETLRVGQCQRENVLYRFINNEDWIIPLPKIYYLIVFTCLKLVNREHNCVPVLWRTSMTSNSDTSLEILACKTCFKKSKAYICTTQSVKNILCTALSRDNKSDPVMPFSLNFLRYILNYSGGV